MCNLRIRLFQVKGSSLYSKIIKTRGSESLTIQILRKEENLLMYRGQKIENMCNFSQNLWQSNSKMRGSEVLCIKCYVQCVETWSVRIILLPRTGVLTNTFMAELSVGNTMLPPVLTWVSPELWLTRWPPKLFTTHVKMASRPWAIVTFSSGNKKSGSNPRTRTETERRKENIKHFSFFFFLEFS